MRPSTSYDAPHGDRAGVDRVKVNATPPPSFTKTDLNNYAGTQTVEEGAREPVRVALLGPKGPRGTFARADGVIPR
jgi:hypothetical protein